ncbi:MAG: aldo/keto reductase [Ruminococcus sp.]|nr:aldo/keto reductase [Ruminococcus sp.]
MISYTLKNDKYEIKLPSLTFGTSDFMRHDNDEVYFELLDTYCSCGGWFIDTARVYCDWLENGHNSSEGVIGRWIKARNNRDKIVLATKGGHPAMGHMDKNRLSREDLEKDINDSLECLGTDHVDIFFLHRDDTKVPVEEIMPVLNDIYQSGKAHFIGVSNWSCQRIQAANDFAAKNGMEPIRISQIYYSLAHASSSILGDPTLVCMDTKEFRWYSENKFPLMAFSPQAKGFFAKLAKGDAAQYLPEGQYASTANLARLARVKELSARTGSSPAVIPFGYLSSQPFFVTSVFAASRPWQIEENMAAQDLRYDEKTVAFLENKI